MPASTRDSANQTGTDTSADTTAVGRAFDPLWDLAYPPTLRLTIPSSDWEDALWSILPEDDCARRPYLMATLDLDNPKTLDTERHERVGIRWRGHSSLIITEPLWQRPGIKLTFDDFEEGRRVHDAKKLNLMGTEGDYSLMHELVAFSVARKVGLAVPELNFAHLYVNGDYVGLYPLVEEGDDDPFLERHFNGDDHGEFFEVDGYCGGRGRFDDLDQTAADLEQTYEPKAHTEVADIDAVVLPIVRCVAEPDDAQFKACIEPLVDVDSALLSVAVDAAVANPDGLHGASQNYTFYRPERSGKVVFNPWDMDLAFSDELLAFPEHISDLRPTWAADREPNQLTARLVAVYGEAYCTTLDRVLDATDPAVLLPEVQGYYQHLKPLMAADPFLSTVAWGEAYVALEDAITRRHQTMRIAVDACLAALP